MALSVHIFVGGASSPRPVATGTSLLRGFPHGLFFGFEFAAELGDFGAQYIFQFLGLFGFVHGLRLSDLRFQLQLAFCNLGGENPVKLGKRLLLFVGEFCGRFDLTSGEL
jgi:hypothetical protein